MTNLELRDELPIVRDLVSCALMASESLLDGRPLATLFALVEARLGALIDALDDAAADDAETREG